MEPQFRRSDWYDQSLPEALPPDLPDAPRAPERKPKKRRTGALAAGIAVLVLVLIAASVYLVSGRLPFRTSESENGGASRPSQPLPLPSSGPQEDFDEDFRDFFRSYYSAYEDEETAKGSNVARVAGDPGVQLELISAAGRPEKSLGQIYTECVDWVVAVESYKEGSRGYGWGSGIVLSGDGYIITNQHIIDQCDRAVVVLSDGTEYEALLVGEDLQTDLAVLRIEAKNLNPAVFGDSGELVVGDKVAAIGNPLGDEFTGTLTDGIVSAIDRIVYSGGKSMTLIQTNAALNEGNSGGPLLNGMGQVVGITNMKMSNSSFGSVTIEGIGFAIPSATVHTVANQLIACGEVRGRPAMGITVGQVPSEAKEHYDLPNGLYISKVTPGSGADKAGVQAGDVLTHINGQPVRTTHDVLVIRDSLRAGDAMSLTLWRDGQTMNVDMVLSDVNDVS